MCVPTRLARRPCTLDRVDKEEDLLEQRPELRLSITALGLADALLLICAGSGDLDAVFAAGAPGEAAAVALRR